MKKLFVIVLLGALSCIVAKGEGKAPFMTRSFSASSIKEVEAATSGGSLILTGDADSKAIVEMYVSRNNWSAEKIKQVLDENYTIDIRVESGKLYAVVKQKSSFFNWNNHGLSISFKITVPKQLNSNLRTSGGNIQISNLSGSHDFKTSGGSLSIENVSGNILGATSGGSIMLTGSKGDIDLKTSGGSITANDCNGSINLRTSGGSLSMSNLDGVVNAATSGGSVAASNIKGTFTTGTSGGSMHLDGISGNVDATTSGGSMNVKIKSVKDYVKLSNSGNINLTLPAGKGYNMNVKSNGIDISGSVDFRGSRENKNMEGTIGNGGPEITVRSSQRVRLSFE